MTGHLPARVLPALALLLAWEAAARAIGNRLFPPASAVMLALVQDARHGPLLHNLAVTLGRVAAAFTVAMLLGSVLGVAMGRMPRLDRALDSLLTGLLNLPALVGIVLIYVWFGLSETTAIAAVALNKLPSTAVTVREGARALDRGLADMARSFRMGRSATLRHVVLPQLYPYLFGAARSGLALDLEDRAGGGAARPQRRRGFPDPGAVPVVRRDGHPGLHPGLHRGGAGDRVGAAAAAGAPGQPVAVAPFPTVPFLTVDVTRKEAGGRTVIEGLRFSLLAGEIVALVGPSGCGKTTLLRLVGGLDRRFEGRIAWASGAAPRIGTVFQEPRLLPWRTVRQNIALVHPPDPAAAEALLTQLGLAPYGGLYPPALSLGMARRAAIARAFAIQPALLLLDEPFVSLDPAMAEQGRAVLTAAWAARRCAALLVTHDLAEAASLADRILLLSTGPARVVREVVVPEARRRQGIAEGARVVAELLP